MHTGEREKQKIHAECQNAKSVSVKQLKPQYTEKIYPILKPKATPVELSRNEETVIWKQISWSMEKEGLSQKLVTKLVSCHPSEIIIFYSNVIY